MLAEMVSTMISQPDIRMLDERLNYLHLPAVEEAVCVLRGFRGNMLLTEHDHVLLE